MLVSILLLLLCSSRFSAQVIHLHIHDDDSSGSGEGSGEGSGDDSGEVSGYFKSEHKDFIERIFKKEKPKNENDFYFDGKDVSGESSGSDIDADKHSQSSNNKSIISLDVKSSYINGSVQITTTTDNDQPVNIFCDQPVIIIIILIALVLALAVIATVLLTKILKVR